MTAVEPLSVSPPVSRSSLCTTRPPSAGCSTQALQQEGRIKCAEMHHFVIVVVASLKLLGPPASDNCSV